MFRLLGHLGCGLAVEREPGECQPGLVLQVRLDHGDQLLEKVLVVVLVPAARQLARRVFELGDELIAVGIEIGGGAVAFAPEVAADPVDGDALERRGNPSGPWGRAGISKAPNVLRKTKTTRAGSEAMAEHIRYEVGHLLERS